MHTARWTTPLLLCAAMTAPVGAAQNTPAPVANDALANAMTRVVTPADRAAQARLYARDTFTLQLSDWLQPDSLQAVGIDGRITLTRVGPRLYRSEIRLQPEKVLAEPNPFGPNLSALFFVTTCLYESLARAQGLPYHNLGGPPQDEDALLTNDMTWYVGLMDTRNDNPPAVGGPFRWEAMSADQRSLWRDMPERMQSCDVMLLPGAEQRVLAAAEK